MILVFIVTTESPIEFILVSLPVCHHPMRDVKERLFPPKPQLVEKS